MAQNISTMVRLGVNSVWSTISLVLRFNFWIKNRRNNRKMSSSKWFSLGSSQRIWVSRKRTSDLTKILSKNNNNQFSNLSANAKKKSDANRAFSRQKRPQSCLYKISGENAPLYSEKSLKISIIRFGKNDPTNPCIGSKLRTKDSHMAIRPKKRPHNNISSVRPFLWPRRPLRSKIWANSISILRIFNITFRAC